MAIHVIERFRNTKKSGEGTGKTREERKRYARRRRREGSG
jgi:hypothetical protein